MGRKLNWVGVLNEQANWRTRADLNAWFSDLVGRNTNLWDGSIESFEESLFFMRAELGKLHFGEPCDLGWLDTQLKTVTLGLLHLQGAQEGENSSLPQLRARVKGLHDSDLLRSVKDTLLIQFAEFISNCREEERCLVLRCEGVYQAGASTNAHGAGGNGNGNGNAHGNGHANGENAAPPASHSSERQELLFPPEMESRWMAELSNFSAQNSAEDLRRCANLFEAVGKTRFCSDACRFATLQLAKQVQSLQTVPSKSRRYARRGQGKALAEQQQV